MTINFLGEHFHNYEYWNLKPYIGYFTPEGKLISYNNPVGGSHSCMANIVSWTFLLWIKQSDAFKSLNIQDFKIQNHLYLDNGIITGGNVIGTDEYYRESNLKTLQKDLINFLKIAESNEDFINSVKSRIDISKFPNYVKNGTKMPGHYGWNGQESIYEVESLFGRYNTKELLLFLKDICIQYLGYDAIEQFKANGDYPVFDKVRPFFYVTEKYYNYLENPRIISTTNNNINERFYNYLLMDWKVHQLPKYIFNKNTKRFEIQSVSTYFFRSHQDEICEKEIQSIKKLVPLKQRSKYFR